MQIVLKFKDGSTQVIKPSKKFSGQFDDCRALANHIAGNRPYQMDIKD